MKPPVHSNTTKQNNLHIVEQENNNPLTNEGTYQASLWQIRTLFMPEQNVSDMIWLKKKKKELNTAGFVIVNRVFTFKC